MKADHQQSFLQRLCQDLAAVSNYMIKGSTWSAFTLEFAFCEIGFGLFDIYFQRGVQCELSHCTHLRLFKKALNRCP